MDESVASTSVLDESKHEKKKKEKKQKTEDDDEDQMQTSTADNSVNIVFKEVLKIKFFFSIFLDAR